MDIQAIKRELQAFEAADDRADVYALLKKAWNEHKTPALASLIVQQMIDYLLWLDMGSPQEKWEYDSYRTLLIDAVDYGSLNYPDDKLFLWLMLYYFSGYATCYWLLDAVLAKRGPVEKVNKELADRAERVFPGSMMFRVSSDIRNADPTWTGRLSAEERIKLKAELTELKLQNNSADEKLKNLFHFEQL